MPLKKQPLGSTGFEASILCTGDLADRSVPLEQKLGRHPPGDGFRVERDRHGPSYEDGYSEAIEGAALQGLREGMFVIDEIDHLDQLVNPQVEAPEGPRSG